MKVHNLYSINFFSGHSINITKPTIPKQWNGSWWGRHSKLTTLHIVLKNQVYQCNKCIPRILSFYTLFCLIIISERKPRIMRLIISWLENYYRVCFGTNLLCTWCLMSHAPDLAQCFSFQISYKSIIDYSFLKTKIYHRVGTNLLPLH